MSARTSVDPRTTSTEVVVLLGGRSSEREVSLKSGAAIAAALRANADGRGPKRVHVVEIAADGRWMFEGEAHSAGELVARTSASTVFFLGLHGGEGENGTIQGLLAASGRVFTGSGVGASALCMNKSWTKAVLSGAGIRVAPGISIHPLDWREDRARCLADAVRIAHSGGSGTDECGESGGREASHGFAVKPESGGSSVATFLLESESELASAIERVLATGDRALVERRIVGTEATCGVLGNALGALRALTPVEIVPNAGRFFDYEEKYSATGARELCPPRTIAPETCARIRELASRAHRAAGCDGYSRIDFMIPRAEAIETEPIALEINTLPGMTDRSLLPQAASVEGLEFRDLCLAILGLALQRAEEKR